MINIIKVAINNIINTIIIISTAEYFLIPTDEWERVYISFLLKYKNYNSSSCVLRVRNSVSHFEGGHRLRVSESRVLSTFGPKMDEDGPWKETAK
jgi:hypothetical protein